MSKKIFSKICQDFSAVFLDALQKWKKLSKAPPYKKRHFSAILIPYPSFV